MLRHPLIDLLSSLSTKELKDFEKELQSKARTDNEQLKLLKHLSNYHPNYSEERKELSIDYILNTVLGSKSQNNNPLSRLMTKIRPKLEEFITQQQLKEQPFIAKYLLMSACKERGVKEKYEKEKKAILEQLKENNKIDAWQNIQKFLLHFELYFSSRNNKHRSKKTNMDKMENALTEFYLVQQLILLIEKKARSTNHKETFSPMNVKALKSISKSTSQSRLVEWLWECFENFDNVPLIKYRKLKKHLFELSNQLNDSTTGICIGFLLGIGIDNVKHGKQDFFYELWELYQWIFGFKANDNPLIEHKALDITTFSNVVSAAVADNQFKWAENFIKTNSQYLQHLKKDLKNATIQIAKAEIAFRQENYQEALNYLKKLKKPHLGIKLKTYCLSLLCYFGLEYLEVGAIDYFKEIQYIEQNFNRFLCDNKELNDKNKEAGFNFLKMYKQSKKLYQQKEKVKDSKIALRKTLYANQPIFYTSWFEKVITSR